MMLAMQEIPLGLINGLGVPGLLVILFIMLATGQLHTKREMKDKNETIALLRGIVKTRDEQLALLINVTLPTTNAALSGIREAAGEDDLA